MLGASHQPAQSTLVDFYGLTLIARWVLGWALRPIARPLPDSDPALNKPPTSSKKPSVAIVIPARNEAANLPTLLAGLATQTYPCQIVVADDHSTDATAELAVELGAKLVVTPKLPPEWTGKAWACWQGAQKTDSKILIFLDADTVPAPSLVNELVNAVQNRSGLISVQPYHKMVKPTERFAAMFNLLGAMGARLGRNDASHSRRRRLAPMAFGPVLATTRRDYDLTGGHQAIKAAIVEDVAIGRLYQRHNLSVSTFAGRSSVAFRMYPAGVAQMFEGFVKNLATGLASSNLVWSLGVIAWFSGVMVASWELPYVLVKWLATSQSPAPETLAWVIALYLGYAIQIAIMLRPLGNFGLSALLMPIGVIVFIVVFGWSVIKAWQGQVTWKGRVVSTRNSSPDSKK